MRGNLLNLLFVLKKVEVGDLAKVKVLIIPVKLLLNLKLKLLPVAVTHRLVTEPSKERNSVEEGIDAVIQVLSNVPLLLLFGQLAYFELNLLRNLFHLPHVELIEVDDLPLLPVVVPLLLNVPNVEQ